MSPKNFSSVIGSLVISFLLLLLPLTLSGQSKQGAGKKSAGQMGSTSSAGGGDELKEQLKKMEVNRGAAVVRGDTATLDKTTTDDYTLIDMSGKISSGKAAMIERIKSGEIKLTQDKVEDIAVHVYGNVAVVTGTATVSGKVGGHDVNNQQLRFTRVWVKRNGQWMSAAFQQTAVAK